MTNSMTARPAGNPIVAILAAIILLVASAAAVPAPAFAAPVAPAATPASGFGFTSDPEAGDPYPRSLADKWVQGFAALKPGSCVVHGLMAEGGPGSGSRVKVTIEGVMTDQVVPLVALWPEKRLTFEELDALLETVGVKRLGTPLFYTRGTGGGEYQDWLRQASTCPAPAPTEVATAQSSAWTAFLTERGFRAGDTFAYQEVTWQEATERKLYAAYVQVIEENGGLRLSVIKSWDAKFPGGATAPLVPWGYGQLQSGLGVPVGWVEEVVKTVNSAPVDPSGSRWVWWAMPPTQAARIKAAATPAVPAPVPAPVTPLPVTIAPPAPVGGAVTSPPPAVAPAAPATPASATRLEGIAYTVMAYGAGEVALRFNGPAPKDGAIFSGNSIRIEVSGVGASAEATRGWGTSPTTVVQSVVVGTTTLGGKSSLVVEFIVAPGATMDAPVAEGNILRVRFTPSASPPPVALPPAK